MKDEEEEKQQKQIVSHTDTPTHTHILTSWKLYFYISLKKNVRELSVSASLWINCEQLCKMKYVIYI